MHEFPDVIPLHTRILVGLAVCLALAALEWLGRRTGRNVMRLALTAAATTAAFGLALFLVIAWRQLRFPLQLEAMELTILQHAERLAAGLPVYPHPSADFVALAYNPGLYLLLWPALKIAPPSLFLLRLPDLIASLVLIGIFGYVLKRLTGSWRWAVVAAVFPVLATRSFDCNLVTGHADILVIAIALVGALILSAERLPLTQRDRELLSAALLVSAFWFKQNAAVMGVGSALIFLLRDWRRAWRPIGALIMFGPVAYWLAGPSLFGPDFIDATLRVPSSWSQWSPQAPERFLHFSFTWWAVPFAIAGVTWFKCWREKRLVREPLVFLYPFALASGLLGALDAGSSDNVFSLAGAWMLVLTLTAAGPWLRAEALPARRRLAVGSLVMTAAFLAHDPRDWNPPSGAPAAYADFVKVLQSLDGPVYAPWLGNLPIPLKTTARAHWVALEDRVRGSGTPGRDNPFVERVLEPVDSVRAPAYLITSSPLEQDYLLSWLSADYTLQQDYGKRWDALHELPHRFGARHPRYLYRRTSS